MQHVSVSADAHEAASRPSRRDSREREAPARAGVAAPSGAVSASAAGPTLARTAFYLLSAGATATLVSLLYRIEGRDDVGVAVSAIAAYGLAIVCLVGFDRLSLRSFQLLSAGAVAGVSSGLAFGGPSSGFYQLFYVWIALFVAYYFRPAAAAL